MEYPFLAAYYNLPNPGPNPYTASVISESNDSIHKISMVWGESNDIVIPSFGSVNKLGGIETYAVGIDTEDSELFTS